MSELDRRKFIKKSFLGITGFTFLINTISCNDNEIIIKNNQKIDLPNRVYVATHILDKKYSEKNYRLNDESRIELFISGVILLKNPRLLKKLEALNLHFEEINNTHYKIYFNRVIVSSITKGLFKNDNIHYIIEDVNLNKKRGSASESSINSFKINSFFN